MENQFLSSAAYISKYLTECSNADNAAVHDTCEKMMYQLLTFGWRQSNIWPQYCLQKGGGF